MYFFIVKEFVFQFNCNKLSSRIKKVNMKIQY